MAGSYNFLSIVLERTLWAYYLTHDVGRFDTNLFDFLTWHVIAASLAGFIVIKSVAQYLEKYFSPATEKIIVLISSTTFGIYLVHDQILGLMETGALGFHLTTNAFQPLFATPLTILVAFLLSLVMTYLLQKIPIVKLMTPCPSQQWNFQNASFLNSNCAAAVANAARASGSLTMALSTT